MDMLVDRLIRAFSLTFDLYNSLDNMKLTIENVPSNTIGEQAWCIVGARESYLTAIKKGSWQGFSCSLQDVKNKKSIIESLDKSQILFQEEMNEIDSFSIYQQSSLFDLLEHEIQHHGQLIRFVFTNKLQFPQSWNERYTV